MPQLGGNDPILGLNNLSQKKLDSFNMERNNEGALKTKRNPKSNS
jgi:hypothetical protein